MEITVVLAFMVGVYFVLLFSEMFLKKYSKISFCVVCGTVVATWLTLIALKFSGNAVNPVIPAILMGQSVVGAMYTLEKYAQKNKQEKLLLLKPVIIVVGTAVVYMVITSIFI